jgi:hypothetical protein
VVTRGYGFGSGYKTFEASRSQVSMMQGETILAIATESWDSLWRSTQQYLSRIAIHNKVLYFEPGRRPDRSASSEFIYNLKNLFITHYSEGQDNLIRINSPSSIPYFRQNLPQSILHISVPIAARVNTILKTRFVLRVMRELKVVSPILFLFSPDQKDFVGHFREKLACYFNYDEFSIFIENNKIKHLVRQFDNELTKKSDLVFSTSRSQYDQRVAINPNTYFLPNGVDFQLFNQALAKNLPIPNDIREIPRPIIGYSGLVGSQLDLNLLSTLCKTYPNYSIVLMGPDQLPDSEQAQNIKSLLNVHFLGRKDRTSLPNYLQVFDVALIPYSLRGFVLSANPLKLHEYLAAGRSVVATDMPELRSFSSVIRIAQSPDEFIEKVKEAISDYSEQSIERRVTIAQEYDWDRRFNEMSQVIDNFIHNNAGRDWRVN